MPLNEPQRGARGARWLAAAASLLPLLVLFLAYAAGVPIPIWLYLLALGWGLLLPLWFSPRRSETRAIDTHEPHQQVRPVDTLTGQRDMLHRLADAVDPAVFDIQGQEVAPTGLVLRGHPRATPEDVQRHVAQRASSLLGRSPQVMVHEDPDGTPYVLIPNADFERALLASVPPRRPLVNLALFATTLVTTTFAGAAHQGVNLLERPEAWTAGLPYGFGVMLILGVHEMGHYLAARHHGVPVSLPYFIPVPFALGTFGAFIRLPPLLKTRRQLFDIGVAGPLAGLAIAIPALAIGLQRSVVLPVEQATGAGMHVAQGVSLNSSILLALVSKAAIGEAVTTGHYVVLHPLAFAGWLGLMITALNLLPVGQLDGGHIAHALFGRGRARTIGSATLVALVGLGLFVWSGLLFWALMVFFIAGTPGMPPMEDVTALDGRRRAVAWGSFALLALILLPLPHAISPEIGLHCPYV